jgi:hypothetical protein
MYTFIPFASDDAVAAIGKGLVARTLPKSEWTHAAHFASVLWLLVHHPEWDAERTMPELIRAYNESTGTANTGRSCFQWKRGGLGWGRILRGCRFELTRSQWSASRQTSLPLNETGE